MMSSADSFEFTESPKAATMPSRMGTTAPARAVADGTKNARMIEMTIEPTTMREVFSPANLST